MRARDFVNIHQVQAGIDVGRKFAVQEIHNDAARWRWLDVIFAYGRGRIHHDNVCPGARCLHHRLLGHELRALVVADHVGEHDRRLFVTQLAIRRESHGRDGAGVHHAADTLLSGGPDDIAGALDVGAIHLLRVAHPKAVIGGNVEDEIAALHAASKGFRVSEISGHELRFKLFYVRRPAGLSRQQAKLGALRGQLARNV
jgi:hypothetical protein